MKIHMCNNGLTLFIFQKNKSVVFKNTMEVVNIRTRTGWYLVTCSSGHCRKGLARTREGFKCKGCDSTVLFPHIRYKLHLEVRDDTTLIIVTLFDEPAEQLGHRTAKSLVEEERQGLIWFSVTIVVACF
uniref:replication factor A protein 1-like isoform X2 n=1 Tax=Erigeron canadensis TaxID=72917 RepID=UPI001CB93B02|nr:replication factor A protein 1-like isoform X2 [Erigeron canadensis]